MDVIAVTNQLDSYLLAREDGARDTWRTVRHRRHPIEQMGCVLRSRVDCRHCFIDARARMTERDSVTGGHQATHELEASRQLGSQRDDSDIWPRRSNDVEDVTRGKFAVASSSVRDSARRIGHPVRDMRWQSNAFGGLCAGVRRVDEVAFQMRRQYARASGRARGSRPCYLRKNAAQLARRAGHGRRTKRGHAIAWQPRRNSRHRLTRIERVIPFDAVNVHVDEARDDVALAGVDDCRPTHVGAGCLFDRRYTTALDNE
jgi:hypothetical protein